VGVNIKVLPEYSDFTEAINYLRSRKLNSVQHVKYRQDIAAAKRGGTYIYISAINNTVFLNKNQQQLISLNH